MSRKVYNVGLKSSKRTMPNRIVCFVCGSLGGEYQLRSRPCEGCAFFPFLEHHDPPKGSRIPGPDGIVDSCRVCYAFLTSQWETYERTNTPAIKRLYWLKRLDDGQFTGAEMKLQGEYMAQVMGLQYQPSCGDSCAPHSPDSRDGSGTGIETDVRAGRKSQPQDDSDHVLDLSVSFKSEPSAKASRKQHSSGDIAPREVAKTRARFEEFSFVCFTCGIEIEGVAAKCISSVPHGANEPFFPFLIKLMPPKGAVSLNGQGVCQVCDRCFSSLCHQWLTYEHHGTPNSARIFKVNAQFFSNDSNIALGVVPDTLSASGEVCYLCSKSWSSSKICSLYTAPISGKGDQMYFPFIRELRRPPGARPLNPDGSVLVCVSCFSNLQDQWQCYEADKVPFLQRRYSLLPPSSSASSISSLSLKPFTDSDIKCDTGILKSEGFAKSLTQPLAIEISKSPTFTKNHTHSLPSGPLNQSSLATVGTSTNISSTTAQESSRHHSVDTKSHSSSAVLSIPHPLQQAGERPKKVCFLCGEKCLLSKAQILYSYPIRHESKSAGGQSQTIPFFPFLASHPPAPGSEQMTEEGTVISCSYCFYSLLNQWRDFEDSKGVTERNRMLRKYTLNEFVCYVCGMMVPRKKMRTLEVHKFLFLREHKAPPNALVMWGGEGVGACGSCHYSLSHQFTEFERLGLPMELRKYNWTVQHHTEENGSDAHDSNHGVSSAAVNEDSNLSVTEGAEDSNHSSPQSTKPVLSLISPATFGKPMHKSALVLPQNRSSPSNGLTSSGSNTPLNTSRTSSFAAALRNLAHHAKEPSDDVSDHSLTSPTNHNSHNSRSNTPKRGQANLMLPTHPATSFTSPPVVTVAPTQSMMFQGMASFPMIRECHERASTFEHWNKSVQDHPQLSSEDSGLGGKDLLLSRNPARVPAQRSVNSGGIPVTSQQALNLYARSIHAYRAEEEELIRHGLPLSYGMDPASYAAAAYHPALLQQQAAFAQGSLRLGDSLLLDQYRMLQMPYLPFQTAGLISPHHLGIGMHTMLAAAAASQHYHPSLFPQHYPYLNLGQPMMDPQVAAQAAAMDRNQLDIEKDHIKREKEKSKHHEQLAEKEANHRILDADLVKKEHSRSESFGKAAFERRDIPTVPICLSSHSPEILSRQYNESHNGHPSSRASSSMSASSGHRPVSKISPGTNHQSSESSLDKSSHNLTLSTHHGPVKSHGTVSPSRGLTFKPYDKHYDSSHHTSQPVLDLHVHQGSTLPLLVRSSSSSSNSALEKSKGSSDFTPLFRPFDDNKQNVETNSSSSYSASLRHKQWQLDTSSSLSAFHKDPHTSSSSSSLSAFHKDPHTSSSASSLSAFHKDPHTSSSASVVPNTDINSWTSPLSTLPRSPSLVPKQHKLKQTANCLNERIEKFYFKSLACENTSSSSHHKPNLASSDVIAPVGTKQFLSKHDIEAARALERKKRGEDSDSDVIAPVGSKQFLSKHDIEAARALERKKRGEDSDSDIDKDEEEMGRVRLTMIGRTTPTPMDGSPPKVEMFEHSALTTWRRKKDQGTAHSDFQLTEVDPAEKSAFISRLGLMPVNEHQRAELEKRRRYLAEINWARQSPLQTTRSQDNRGTKAHHGTKRKLSEAEDNLQSTQNVQSAISEQNAGHAHGYLGQFSSSSTPVSYQLTQNRDARDKTRTSSNPESSVAHQSQQKDLLRLPESKEHHPLSGAAHSLISSGGPKTTSVPLTSRNVAPHQAYPWPGIEAVLESYQRHREEQLAETQVLREHCRQLQADHGGLEQTAHRVSRHMAYLIEENQRMLEERNGYQDAINHLKETFSNLKGKDS